MSGIDDGLQEQVHTAISKSPFLTQRKLRYETHNGRVTLLGKVGSYYQKQMAQEALRTIEGVEEIDNKLEVCWN